MANFVPRLDSYGMSGSDYYYSGNPFYQAGYGLPNCTCYAWGRWYELLGYKPSGLSTGNADTWIDRNSTYEVGYTPKLGAILVSSYDGGGDGGHVSVVEQINNDGSIITSNSAWGGSYFYTEKLWPPYEFASYVNFLGFLYPPIEFSNGISFERWMPD